MILVTSILPLDMTPTITTGSTPRPPLTPHSLTHITHNNKRLTMPGNDNRSVVIATPVPVTVVMVMYTRPCRLERVV